MADVSASKSEKIKRDTYILNYLGKTSRFRCSGCKETTIVSTADVFEEDDCMFRPFSQRHRWID